MRLIAIVASIGMTGCSWMALDGVYANGPQAGGHPWVPQPEACESSAPDIDTAMTIISAIGAGSLGAVATTASTVEQTTCNNGQCSTFSPQEYLITSAVAVGVAVPIFLASAIYGYNTESKCHRTEAEQAKLAREYVRIQAEKDRVNTEHLKAQELQKREEVAIEREFARQQKEEEDKRQAENRIREQEERIRAEAEATERAKEEYACQTYVKTHCNTPQICNTQVKQCKTVHGEYVCWNTKECYPGNLVCTGKAPVNCSPQ